MVFLLRWSTSWFFILILVYCCWNGKIIAGRSTRKRQRSRSRDDAELKTFSEPPIYRWDEIKPMEPTSRSSRIRGLIDQRKSINASTKTHGLPVYITMTTISSRVHKIEQTIISLLNGDVLADRIYLFISSEPFLLDAGIPVDQIPLSLLELSYYFPFTIVYTDNLGPHRKLLPLLAKKWQEDCLIVTFDDENQRGLSTYLRQSIKYYTASNGQAIVSLRARKMGFCDVAPYGFLSYNWWIVSPPHKREYFLLPTGAGSILYRPKFFHPIVFDRRLRELTKAQDDITFRLATMLLGVEILVGCYNNKQCPRKAPKLSSHTPIHRLSWTAPNDHLVDDRNAPSSPLQSHTTTTTTATFIAVNLTKRQAHKGSKAKNWIQIQIEVPSEKDGDVGNEHDITEGDRVHGTEIGEGGDVDWLNTDGGDGSDVVDGNDRTSERGGDHVDRETKRQKHSSSRKRNDSTADSVNPSHISQSNVVSSSSQISLSNPASSFRHTHPSHRRKLKESLYGKFNRAGGGNDHALRSAVHYLQSKHLIDLSNVTTFLLPQERPNCMKKGWKDANEQAKKAYDQAQMYGKNEPLDPTKYSRKYGRECSIRQCFRNNFYSTKKEKKKG